MSTAMSFWLWLTCIFLMGGLGALVVGRPSDPLGVFLWLARDGAAMMVGGLIATHGDEWGPWVCLSLRRLVAR